MEETKTYTTVDSLNSLSEIKYLELLNSGKIKDILNTMGRFVKETIDNDILIIDQMPEATKLYSKIEWEKVKNRQLVESPKFVNLVGLTLYKNEQGPIDDRGSLHVIGTTKLHTHVRTLYDISQTSGAEIEPEIDKEKLAGNFDAVKNSLEYISRGYKIKFDDIKEKSNIDKQNKVITIQNGMSLNDVITELVNQTTKVVLDNRQPEGIKKEKMKNISQLEHQAAVYAIHCRYGLDIPEFDFSDINSLSNEEKLMFKDNLGKVRSVVYHITHNLENSIDYATRMKNKDKFKDYHSEDKIEKSNQKQNEGGVL